MKTSTNSLNTRSWISLIVFGLFAFSLFYSPSAFSQRSTKALEQGKVLEAQEPKTYSASEISQKTKALDNTFFHYEMFNLALTSDIKNELEQRNKGVDFSFYLELGQKAPMKFTVTSANLFRADFKFRELTESGSRVGQFDTDIAFKGFINDDPEQKLRLTISDETFYAWFIHEGVQYHIEPVWYLDQRADKAPHIMYRKSDVRPTPELTCGNDEEEEKVKSQSQQIESMPPGCLEAEMGMAGAFDMVGKYGSTAAVGVKMTGVTNNIQPLYDGAGFAVNYIIVDIVVPATLLADPWSSATCMTPLLASFVSWAPGGFLTHDIGQLWVNRDVMRGDPGPCNITGLIGRAASLGGICTSLQYNCCEDWQSTNAAAQAHLSAHECGHNWNGLHGLAANANDIMWSTISSASPNTVFSAANIASISAHINTRTCLAACPAPMCLTAVGCQLPDQLGHGGGGTVGATSDLNPGAGFRVQDNFIPTTNTPITSVCWWGIYVDFGGQSDCSPGTGDNFTVNYYSDALCSPASLFAGPFAVTPTSGVTGATIASGIGPIVEHAYTASHPAVAVVAGTPYWLEIVNNTTGTCYWLWTTAPGDGVGYQSGGLTDYDLAFCLDIPFTSGPCISATIANNDRNGDGTPDISDPCACDDPQNSLVYNGPSAPSGDLILHEVVTVASGAGETWNLITLNSGNVLNSDGSPLAAFGMTESPAGVYTIEFWHYAGIGYDADFSNGAFTLNMFNSCAACPTPVPTMGEWGLIFFIILLMTGGLVALIRRKKRVLA